EIWIVKSRSERVRDAITQLTALVDGAWCFRGAMTADTTGKGELLEERVHPIDVFTLRGINFGVGAFQIHRSQHARGAMPWSSQENRVEVVLLNKTVQMDVSEAQTRTGAPVAEQSILDLLSLQRFTQQRIVLQINHAHGQVIARP